ncbi:hypothetical protein FI615_002214 [Enterococcus faecium]|nr:hypothetical protein [Enterococcus faecium]EMF0115795.1 hypothetical protein [Enterococcus hirae]
MAIRDRFFHMIAEENLYEQANNMKVPDEEVRKFQLKRLLVCGLILMVSIFVYQVFGVFYSIGVCTMIPLYWINKYRGFSNVYQCYIVTQQMCFSDFICTLVPYLLNTSVKRSLFANIRLVVDQITNEYFKEQIYQFLNEMNDKPNTIEPFIRFAERCGGTDESVNFMMTLFRYQQFSDDPRVIQELGRIANEEVFKGIDGIITAKYSRMNSLVMKLVMSFSVPLFGIMGSEVFYLIREAMKM